MKATAPTMQHALGRAFNWGESPQGEEFWKGIWDQLTGGTYFFTEEESAGRALPTDSAERKAHPVYSGFIQYFPHAIAAVSHLSYKGNQQHHPDKPLHWDKDKSGDELDAMMRHLIDEDWVHVAWRAMANLERKLTNKCNYELDSTK
tara:strand:- start:380 stop:820 length:441 start_codon:yes stop_codon:yes gene_type:complete